MLAVVMLPNHYLFVVYCLAMFVCLFYLFDDVLTSLCLQ